MRRPFDIITFDCYGTLIDWESGIADAFVRAAAEKGVILDRQAVVQTYSRLEPLVEHETYRRYRDVLRETALRVGRALGWRIEESQASFLPASLPQWQPFRDTNDALEKLSGAGYRLGILSNTDDDLIAATRKHFTVDFDLVITAQQVRSYKPAHGHFLAAREKLGGKASRWLHAAQSNFHDILPANQLDIPNAWINRKQEPPLPGGRPVYEFENLEHFAAELTDVRIAS